MAARGKIRKAADVAGVDQATVRRALQSSGKIDAGVDEIVQIVRDNADPDRIIGHAAHERGDGGSAGNMSPLTLAKLRKENLQVAKLQIENAKAIGELIDREAVAETGRHLIATARTALLSLGHRLAAKVAGKSDLIEIARIVETEVRDVLGALADEATFFDAVNAEALS